MKNLLILSVLAVLTTGCSTPNSGSTLGLGTTGQRESNPAGVRAILIDGQLRTLDLASLVESFNTSGSAPGSHRSDTTEQAENRLNSAIAKFYAEGSNPERQRQLRDEIQAGIIAAANQRCGLWKNKFSHGSSLAGFWFGSIASAASAGSLAFTEKSTKTALTAVGATSSGAGAQYEKSYLFNQTVGVIFLGIDTRRENILNRIREKSRTGSDAASSRSVSIDAYALSAAIADALEYHSACTAASGLQKASEALVDDRKKTAATDTATKPVGANPTAPVDVPDKPLVGSKGTAGPV